MTTIKLSLNAPKVDFELLDKKYTVYINDNVINQMGKATALAGKFAKMADDMDTAEDVEKAGKQIVKMFDTSRVALEGMIDGLLGEKGIGEQIYNKCNKSTMVLIDVVNQMDSAIGKVNQQAQAARQKALEAQFPTAKTKVVGKDDD